jgi:hypothetical protein
MSLLRNQRNTAASAKARLIRTAEYASPSGFEDSSDCRDATAASTGSTRRAEGRASPDGDPASVLVCASLLRFGAMLVSRVRVRHALETPLPVRERSDCPARPADRRCPFCTLSHLLRVGTVLAFATARLLRAAQRQRSCLRRGFQDRGMWGAGLYWHYGQRNH